MKIKKMMGEKTTYQINVSKDEFVSLLITLNIAQDIGSVYLPDPSMSKTINELSEEMVAFYKRLPLSERMPIAKQLLKVSDKIKSVLESRLNVFKDKTAICVLFGDMLKTN